ncbi:MAG: vitamin B12 dependent-methionine synthase activation domain-containing protein, partial [bacterium]
DQKTALRYLGYKDSEPDAAMKELLEKAERRLLSVMRPRYVYRVMNLKDGELVGAPGLLPGKAIQEHLEGCTKAVLLAATLSSSVDTLLRQMSVTGMAEAMAADALASAAVEQVLDLAEEEIFRSLANASLSESAETPAVSEHTFRFSPGYADFPLSVQPRFLEILDAPRRIGLTASPSLLLVPTKSVTCILGVGEHLPKERKKTCKDCTLGGNCSFRKANTFCFRA